MKEIRDHTDTEPKARGRLGKGFLLGLVLHTINAGASAVCGLTWLQIIGFTQFFYVVPIALAIAISKRDWGFVKGLGLASLLLLLGNIGYLVVALSKTGSAF